MMNKKESEIMVDKKMVKVERRLLIDIMSLLKEIDTNMFSWKIVDNEKAENCMDIFSRYDKMATIKEAAEKIYANPKYLYKY